MTSPARLLAAVQAVSTVDRQSRTITGRIITYGEVGRTNLGPLRIRAGAFALGSKVIGTYGHVREQSVARLIASWPSPDGAGLDGTFQVAPTPLGDLLLAEADPQTGTRSGLSIELDGLSVDPWSGEVISAEPLEFVAFVPIGAYASSVTTSVVAQLAQEGTPLVTTPQQPAQAGQQPAPGQPFVYGQPFAQAAPYVPPVVQQGQQLSQVVQQGQAQPAAAAPPQLQAGAAPAGTDWEAVARGLMGASSPHAQQATSDSVAYQAGVDFARQQLQAAATAPGGVPVLGRQAPAAQQGTPAPTQSNVMRQLARLQAQLHNPDNAAQAPQLRAALSDITNSSLNLFQDPANTAATELWSGGGYTRRFVQLMSQKELTSWKFQGWRWLVRPQVGPYAGDKAEVPSNQPTMELVPGEAERLAGAHDIDRKFRDFGDEAFWLGYYSAMAESYAEQSDLIAAEALVSYARTLATAANRPAGYTAASLEAASDVLRAAALGSAVLEDTPNVRRPASYVLMNTADWLGLLNFTNLDLPAFTAMLGVRPENFQRTSQVPAGGLVMGVKEASTFYELGGGSPIRVEAIDVGRAGIDAGVYGYVGTMQNRPGGIITVPIAVPPAPPAG